jgi:hypothetical protein
MMVMMCNDIVITELGGRRLELSYTPVGHDNNITEI